MNIVHMTILVVFMAIVSVGFTIYRFLKSEDFVWAGLCILIELFLLFVLYNFIQMVHVYGPMSELQ